MNVVSRDACTSNNNSAGKEGKCSTFGFPQDPVSKWCISYS